MKYNLPFHNFFISVCFSQEWIQTWRCRFLPIQLQNKFWLPVWKLWPEFDLEDSCHCDSLWMVFQKYWYQLPKYQWRVFWSCHYSLKRHEIEHGYVVKKQQGTPTHLLKSLQSISSYNSLRIGATPPQDFTLRKKKFPSLNSTPKVKSGFFLHLF